MKTALFAVVALVLATPARAGDLRLEFHPDGTVTLLAHEVPVRQILTEWARQGHVRLVNADKIAGGPVSLELTRIPERRALETLLRSTSGYVVGLRTTVAPGLSQFDRIMVMPPSVATAAAARPPVQPPVQQAPPPPQDGFIEDSDDPVPAPAPGMLPGQGQGPGMPQQPGVPGQMDPNQPAPEDVPTPNVPGQTPLRPFITPVETNPNQPGAPPPESTVISRSPRTLPAPPKPPQQ